MRIWETEDNKAIPSDLVREQDFTMRIRRLHRLETPHLVVNIELSRMKADDSGRGDLELAQKRLRSFTAETGGTYAEMSNGDPFIIWSGKHDIAALSAGALKTALAMGANPEDSIGHLFVYRMPEDYQKLRERINHYVEASRAAATRTALARGADETAAQALQGGAARGPLTAWGVNQIERLLEDIDLEQYVRAQPIYGLGRDGVWRMIFEECFLGFNELKQTYFPRMEISAHEHMFLGLCQGLDSRLLARFTRKPELLVGRRLSLNLSVSSVLGPILSAFAHAVPRNGRGNIVFELHRGDLLQDFAMTLNAISVLRHEGFRVALDSITPDMLPYVNLMGLGADYIKINVAGDRASHLNLPQVKEHLAKIPREKLIFFRCESQQALSVGRNLGILMFQGWLVDELVGRKPTGKT